MHPVIVHGTREATAPYAPSPEKCVIILPFFLLVLSR